MQALMLLAHRLQVTLRLPWLTWPTLALYSWITYTSINMYINGWGLPSHQACGKVIVSTLQIILLLAAAVNDASRYMIHLVSPINVVKSSMKQSSLNLSAIFHMQLL